MTQKYALHNAKIMRSVKSETDCNQDLANFGFEYALMPFLRF